MNLCVGRSANADIVTYFALARFSRTLVMNIVYILFLNYKMRPELFISVPQYVNQIFDIRFRQIFLALSCHNRYRMRDPCMSKTETLINMYSVLC